MNQWELVYVNGNKRRASYNPMYFQTFGVEHIRKELKKFLGNKNIYSIRFVNVWILLYWIYCV